MVANVEFKRVPTAAGTRKEQTCVSSARWGRRGGRELDSDSCSPLSASDAFSASQIDYGLEVDGIGVKVA